MSRPLFVTDCDEVLLHMVVPFREWLGEAHAIDFDFAGGDWGQSLTRRELAEKVPSEEVWTLLNGFFDTEMHRQPTIEGAVETLHVIARQADVVVLTNLLDHRQQTRAAQLRQVGIDFPVVCNQGGKGPPLGRIIAEHDPSLTVFVDDLPHHHESVAEHCPEVWRLHMVGEPQLAPHIPSAADMGHAHVRIDSWAEAAKWVHERFANGEPAPAILDTERKRA